MGFFNRNQDTDLPAFSKKYGLDLSVRPGRFGALRVYLDGDEIGDYNTCVGHQPAFVDGTLPPEHPLRDPEIKREFEGALNREFARIRADPETEWEPYPHMKKT